MLGIIELIFFAVILVCVGLVLVELYNNRPFRVKVLHIKPAYFGHLFHIKYTGNPGSAQRTRARRRVQPACRRALGHCAVYPQCLIHQWSKGSALAQRR